MIEASIQKAFDDHSQAVGFLQDSVELLEEMAGLLIESLRAGGKILVFGNGGSAADAQHIAGELLGRFRRERPAFGALALSTDTSTITAIANDYSFDQIFARQVQGLIRPGDVAWALTTSGNSPNVLLALQAARKLGAKTIAFSGGDGGKVAQLADSCLVIPANHTARIQEAHQLAYHILCDLIESALADHRRTAPNE
ncbi:MAG: D-sedoheptulose 7-phosphate isomerase [Phycisphaerae bacterium]|nr:D-sedoheptulose 7-phosphate isomerase [Phycisphaerae bacterium]